MLLKKSRILYHVECKRTKIIINRFDFSLGNMCYARCNLDDKKCTVDTVDISDICLNANVDLIDCTLHRFAVNYRYYPDTIRHKEEKPKETILQKIRKVWGKII